MSDRDERGTSERPSSLSSATSERDGRRPGELGFRELLRWGWRQLTSMRTALVLLFLLALAAIPGSIVPQADVDALKTSRWQEEHPTLTPIYEALGLFSVYDSPWFSAIYLLLMASLVGCILPRTRLYLRAMRARPPKAPRNLSRLPDHTTYSTDESVAQVHQRAAAVLRRRRYRVSTGEDGAVAAERGYLREAGNLLFHLSVLVVLVGFAIGGLFGYRGGVILVVGNGFANNLTQYDDFAPGGLFDPDWMEPFSFTVTDFTAEWLREGPSAGQARNFVAELTYQEAPGEPQQAYDLQVNHPLTIGGTDIFLIGHGYAPVITVRDGEGDVAYTGPTVFLPTDSTFRSFGVVKAPDAQPQPIGLEGEFYPTYASLPDEDGTPTPFSAFGDLLNPAISMLVHTGSLGMNDGGPQSVYALDTSAAELVTGSDGKPFRLDMAPGQTVELPDGLGKVTFEGVQRWNRIQISRTPGKFVALGGVVLALLGLLGSLFIRPRRVWVRAREENGRTVVTVAGLDRSSGGDVPAELALITARMGARTDTGTDTGMDTGTDTGMDESTEERR